MRAFQAFGFKGSEAQEGCNIVDATYYTLITNFF